MTRLLIVEDNEMNRDMLARRLTRRGYEVMIACDGIAGIEAARNQQPDLILMDLSLPEMDGWTAMRILKSDTGTRDIPVVALTAHAMDADREKALLAGCDAFDTKPVEITRLIDIMNRLLQKRNLNYDDHPVS
ncbi:MAG TPA: response regulator [Bryobacteraceae bacterium]|nr:response regulator [Bryobacteraceae bacterium]